MHMHVAGASGPDGLIPSTDRFGTALGDIVRCTACGHMQLEPMPSEDALANAYVAAESEDYVEEEAGQRATAKQAVERIERYAAKGTLLDLGCWVGFLLAEARERGWETLGVEPSAFAANFARERLGLEVLQTDLFAAALQPGSFDAIAMGDVIEHLVDPLAALVRVGELLSAGGVLWLALPDAGSRLARLMGARWWSVIPTHVQYFTRHSLRTLLSRAGFDVLEITTAPKAFTIGYYLQRIAGYSPRLSAAAVGAASAAGVVDRIWAPDFRDRMAVIARRGSRVT